MISVFLPSDALLQHLPSYLGFSYLGHGLSLHSCSSKTQKLLLTLDKGYLLTAALPDLQYVIAPLGPPAPAQPPLLGRGLMFLAAAPGLGHRVAPPGGGPWPRTQGSSSRPLPLTSDTEWLLFAVPVPSQPGTLGRCPWPRMWGSLSWPRWARQLWQPLALSAPAVTGCLSIKAQFDQIETTFNHGLDSSLEQPFRINLKLVCCLKYCLAQFISPSLFYEFTSLLASAGSTFSIKHLHINSQI